MNIEPSPDVMALLSHTSMSQAQVYQWALADAVLLRIERRVAEQRRLGLITEEQAS